MSEFKKILFSCLLVAFLGALATYSSYVSVQKPASNNKYLLSQPDMVSAYYEVNEKNAIKSSVGSAVHVISSTPDGTMISLSSGSYIKYENRFYILTTSHGIIGDCKNIAIVYFEQYTGCVDMAVNNKSLDYALIEVQEMQFRKPIKVDSGLSKSKKKYHLMDKVYYTGYPNSAGPLTFGGTVSGFDEFGLIYIHSYAWSGSSGAGVFDSKGKLIGMIMAIDVGKSEYGVDVLEDIIVVIPIDMIDWTPIFFPKETKNE
jgi:S1-C subfamily serine protease